MLQYARLLRNFLITNTFSKPIVVTLFSSVRFSFKMVAKTLLLLSSDSGKRVEGKGGK